MNKMHNHVKMMCVVLMQWCKGC